VAALGAVALLATPAHAGTGSSTRCSDGTGSETPVLTSPVTVGIETQGNVLILCYGTGATGQPTNGTGGTISVRVDTTTNTVYPGASVHLTCVPDYATGAALSCDAVTGADFALDEVAVTTPPSSLCLVSIGAGCAAYIPGVKVVTDANPNRALLQLVVVGVPVDVGAPPQCVAVIVSCP
jgi:hypothetical protein